MCGCKSSPENTENTELYNEDVNTRHRFLFGVHVSRDPEGVEANVQLACGTIRKKKYERVPAQQIGDSSQATVEQIGDSSQATAQQIEDTSHDNG